MQEAQRKQAQTEAEKTEERECMKIFGICDYQQHKDRNPLRVPGTCGWLLEHPNFKAWRDSENETSNLLWVTADPGCGKSVLARTLIDEDLLFTGLSKPTVCYFFFKDGFVDQQGSANCVASLIHQILCRQPSMMKHALRDFRQKGPKLAESFITMWRIFLAMVEDPESHDITCLLDALDECEEFSRFQIIDSLKKLAVSKDANSGTDIMRLKILVTSRPYENIDRRFKSLTRAIPTIRLRGEEESKAIGEEINLVIRALVPDLAIELDLPSSVEQHLLDRLLSIPNRTYLWLHLIINQIRISSGVSTTSRLGRIISEIPPTVEAAYEDILNKSTDIALAKRLLHIIIAATRPLSLDEMNVALNIQQSARTLEDLELEARDIFYGTVRNLCGLFVSIVDSQIFLIHQTAREWLQAEDLTTQIEVSWRKCVHLPKAEEILLECCMRYLLFDEL
ncbi:hypothetical protein BDZ45DRAFT_583384, partial [Acephala macrosclerotiorum]